MYSAFCQNHPEVLGTSLPRYTARSSLLEQVKTLAPAAVWANDELIVPGPATTRPAVLDAIRAAGGDIRGLTADEGRLDALYRELVGGHP